MTLFWIITFSLLGSVLSILVASSFLLFPHGIQRKMIPHLVSYATGAMLASALLGMIPHASEHLEVEKVLLTVLFGIFLFFGLEKIVIWRHCHKEHCAVHTSTGTMILIGDGFHNFLDGMVIAASFLISFPVGVAVSLSIIAHEIPQELGDFGILLHSGYSKAKALVFNLLSGLTTLVGAILAYFALGKLEHLTPYVMAIAASSFIYIALVDLSPGLHKRVGVKNSVFQIILMAAGVFTVVMFLGMHEH